MDILIISGLSGAGKSKAASYLEDMGFYIVDNMPAAMILKFAEETGETPVLLLDDVMSELDMTCRTSLLREMNGVQTFITCTDESDLEGCREKRSYQVFLGEQGNAGVREISHGEGVPQPPAFMEDPELQ